MITSAALAFLLSARQSQLQTMVGGEMVTATLPTSGYVFPGRTHDGHRETALGRLTGPTWTWADVATKLRDLPAGKPARILVILQLRAEAATLGSNDRKFPSQATIEREELAEIRDGLALAGQVIRLQSGGAVTPVFDIHLDTSVAPMGSAGEEIPWRMNRQRFDPEDAAAIEGYDMAWTVVPRSTGPDRLMAVDNGPRFATLGFWSGHWPLTPSALAGDFARAFALCTTKIEAEERFRSGLEVVSGDHTHNTPSTGTNFSWVGRPEGTFGSAVGEISEAVGRRNGRLVLLSRAVGAPVAPSSCTLKAMATGSAAYYIVYGGPDMTFDIVGWIGPEGKQPKANLAVGFLKPGVTTELSMTLAPSSFPVTEISLVPASELGPDMLREAATLKVSELSVTGLTAYTGFPVMASEPLVAMQSQDLTDVWDGLRQAANSPVTPELRAKVMEIFRSANRTLARSAGECLAKWGSPEAIAALRLGLDKGPFEHTQASGANGLRSLIEAKKLDPLADLTMIDDAAALIANRDWRTREAAAKLLALIPRDNANIAMLLMVGDPEPQVRLTAIAGANLNIELVNQRLLYYAVNDPYEAVRTAAYLRLLGSPRSEVRKEAEGFLADESPFVVQGILRGAGELAIPVLRQALLSAVPDNQAAALDGCFKRKQKVEAEWVKHLATTENLPVQMGLARLVSAGLLQLPQPALQHLMGSRSQGVKDTLAGGKR